MELNNQYKKNVFLGQHTRRYAVCQYPFIVEPLSPVFKQAPEALIAAINDRFHTQTYLMRIRSVQRPNEGLNMDSMKDLTTFTCIARTQRSILLPADIILKVPS